MMRSIAAALAVVACALIAVPATAGPDTGSVPTTGPAPPSLDPNPGGEFPVSPADGPILQAWSQNDFPGLIAAASDVLTKEPKDIVARTMRGAAYFNLDRYDEALADENTVLLTDRPIMAFQIRGAINFERNAYSDAISDETAALAMTPTAFSYGYRGGSRFYSGDAKGAVADLDAALKMSPRDTWALGVRGFAHIDLDDYRAALEDANAGLAIKPNDAYLLSLRGSAKYYLGDYKGSIADETASLGSGPNGYAFSVRGDAEDMLRDFLGTLRDEQAALAHGDTNASTYSTLGDAYTYFRRFHEAVAAYDLALKKSDDARIRARRDWAHDWDFRVSASAPARQPGENPKVTALAKRTLHGMHPQSVATGWIFQGAFWSRGVTMSRYWIRFNDTPCVWTVGVDAAGRIRFTRMLNDEIP